MTYATVCSGINAPGVAWHTLGWRAAFHAEIEPFPCAVLAHHEPQTPNLGNMVRMWAMLHYGAKRIRSGKATTDLKREYVGLVRLMSNQDVWAAGTPCQSFSVAGLRGGLEDARGNLTLVYLKMVAAMRRLRRAPRWIVWENVPGVLSDDGGQTIRKVIDCFTQIGYICDIDILDAQYFGVPQRRRRVFVVCVKLDDLLRQRTPISDRIAGELLAQALLATWAALRPASSPGKSPSASESPTELSADSAREKMRSLDALLGGSAVTKLLAYFGVPSAQSTGGLNGSASRLTRKGEKRTRASKTDTDGCRSSSETGASGGRSLASLLSASWADALTPTSASTTLTSTLSTTSLKTCSFAEVAVDTLLFIVNSLGCSAPAPWSDDCWNLASSILTLLKDVTSHARSTTSELFIAPELRDGWGDCLRKATDLADIVERCLGNRGTSEEVLSLPDRMRWNPPPSREAGQRIAASLTRGADSSGAGGYAGRRREDDYNVVNCLDRHMGSGGPDDNAAQAGHLIAGCLNANGKAAGSATQQDAETGMLVAHALRAEGFDASEDGTGRGTPLVPSVYPCLRSNQYNNSDPGMEASMLVPVAIQEDNQNGVTMRDTAGSLRSDAPGTQPCGTLVGVPVPILEVGKGTTSRGAGPNGCGIGKAGDPMFTLQAGAQHAVAFEQNQRDEVRLVGGDGQRTTAVKAENGMKNQCYVAQPVAFDTTQITSDKNYSNPKPGDPCHPLARGQNPPAVAFAVQAMHRGVGQGHNTTYIPTEVQNAHVQVRAVRGNADGGTGSCNDSEGDGRNDQVRELHPTAFQTRIGRNGRGTPDAVCPTLQGAGAGETSETSDMRPCVNTGMAVRRLTPLECERLQGFPDHHTAIPFRNKPAADGPRYRALGNSMAVPVLLWIGQRIEAVEAALRGKAGAA